MGFMRTSASIFFFLLSFLTFFMGVVVLSYMLWLLATTDNKKFLEGMTMFIYVNLGIGGFWLLTGLSGWIASYKKGGCGMQVFMFFAVLLVAGEIGGILTLSILKIKMVDILKHGWTEINEPTKNFVQEYLNCCGFSGPQDFSATVELIDNSCYRTVTETPEISVKEAKRIKKAACKDKLVDFFYKHKIIWIASLGVLLLLQVVSILLSVYLVNAKKRQMRESSFSSLTHRSYAPSF